MQTNKNTNTHLYVGLFLTILNSLALTYLVFSGIQVQVKASENKDKIVIENANAEDVSKLSSQLVYSGAKGTDTSYYSPSLDSIFKYDNSEYNISENNDYINIYPSKSNTFTIYARVNIVSKTAEDILASRLDYYQDIYKDTKKVSDGKIEGLDYQILTYTNQSIFDAKKKETRYVLSIFKVIDQKIVLSEITYTNPDEIKTIQTDIAKILNTFEISPKNIEQNIKVGIKDIGAEFEYDRAKWTVTSHFDSSIYLTYLSETETNKEFQKAYSAVSISGGKNYNDSTADKYLEEYVGYDKDSHKDDKFTVIEEKKNQEINGVTYTYSTYSYMFIGEKVFVKQAVAIKGDRYIILKISTPSFESDSFKAFEKILTTLKYTEVVALAPNAVLGTNTLEIDRAALIGKPAVVHIFNRTCSTIKVQENTALTRTSGRTYEHCSAGTGTGFIVSNDGYIVTNGHVATPSPLDSTAMGLLTNSGSASQFWIDFSYDIATIVRNKGIDASTFTTNQIVSLVIGAYKELIDQNVISLTSNYENYIENETPFLVDRYTYKLTNESKHFKATTVAGQVDSQLGILIDGASGNTAGITKPDLAILKIDSTSKDLPILKLSDPTLLSVGQEINVIGYPGSAENSTIFASSTTSIPTITNGSISAIKQNQTNTFNLIQIDASVSYGNSGGPVLNSNGEVIAVTTYKISGNEAADFNAGVSVEEVKKYLEANNVSIEQSEVSELFESGLNNFSKSYFKRAIEDFNKVIEKYPNASDIIQPLINISNQKIKDGEDKTPLLNFEAIDKQLEKLNINIGFQTILIAIVVFIALIISVIITIKALGKKKNTPPTPPSEPVNPSPVPVPQEQPVATIQPTVPVQQVPFVVPTEQVQNYPTLSEMPVNNNEIVNPQAPFPPQQSGGSI